MNRLRVLSSVVGIGLLLAAPAHAQTPAGPAGSAEVPTTPPSVPTGSLQRVGDDWRAHTLIGTPVFNDGGQRVATIRDLLITDEGRIGRVVLAVAAHRQLVAVAFSQLQFVPSRRFDMPVMSVRGRTPRMIGAGHPDLRPYGVMLPGVTRESLAQMESVRLVR